MIFKYDKDNGFGINKIFKKEIIEVDTKATENIINSFNNCKLSADKFKLSVGDVNDSLIDYLSTQTNGNATLNGYNQYLKSSSNNLSINYIKTKALTIATKALNIALGMLGTYLISLAINEVVKRFDKFINSSKHIKEAADEARESIKELNNEIEQKSKTIKECTKRYAELSQSIEQCSGKNLSLSNDDYSEFLTISNELAKVLPQLVLFYDTNGNAILDLSGDVDTITNSLKEYSKELQYAASQEIMKDASAIFTDVDNKVTKYKTELQDLQNEYKALSSIIKNQSDNIDSALTVEELGYDSSKIRFYVKNQNDFDVNEFTDKLGKALDGVNPSINHYFDSDENENVIGYNFVINMSNDDANKLIKDSGQSFLKNLNKYQKIINNQIQQTEIKIKRAYSELNYVLYSYLQEDFNYLQLGDSIQNSVQTIINQIDWNSLDLNSIDEAERYILDNILSLFDDDNLPENLQNKLLKLINIDSSSMGNQEYIDLCNSVIMEIQGYFTEHDIPINLNLDFLVKNNKDIKFKLMHSIYKETERNPIDAQMLTDYTSSFTNEEIEYWLDITNGIIGAENKIKEYEKAKNKLNKNINSNFFDIEGNNEAIDKYKQTISDLSEYLKILNTENELSASDIVALNKDYNIISNSVDGYKDKIISLMNYTATNSDIMNKLRNAIDSAQTVAERNGLQFLYNSLQNINIEAQKSYDIFSNLDTAITKLQSSAQLLRNVKESYTNLGYINSSHLDDILSTYPELIDLIIKFNAGIVDSETLFNALEKSYSQDENSYRQYIVNKLKYNEEFYLKFKNSIPDNIKELAESYDIDFNNYKSLCESKLALEKELACKRANIALAQESLYEKDNGEFEDSNTGTKLENHDSLKAYIKSKNDYIEFKNFIDEISEHMGTYIELDTSYTSFGLDGDKGAGKETKDKFNESINWTENSINNLKNEVDNIQNILDNTVGLEAQNDVIDKLNTNLDGLADAYHKAGNSYEDNISTKSKNYKKLLKLVGQEKADEYLNKINSGEIFEEENFIGSSLNGEKSKSEKVYELLTQMSNDRQSALDIYQNEVNTRNTITDNLNTKDQNKLSITENKLETINTKLESSIITEKEKQTLLEEQNSLLTEQYNLKLAIAKLTGNESEQEKLTSEYNNSIIDNLELQRELAISSYENALDYLSNEHSKLENSLKLYQDKGGIATANQYKQLIENVNLQKQMYEYEYNYLQIIISSYPKQSSIYKSIKSQIDDVRSSIDDCTSSQVEYNKALLQLPLEYINKQKQELEYANDITQKSMDKYDNAINAINYIIDSETKGLDKSKEALNKSLNIYEGILSAANKVLDDNIDNMNNMVDSITENYDKMINPLQTELDTLQETNEARENAISLQKAQYELEKARNSQNIKVFKEGIGWVYQADEDVLHTAQEEYDDALYSNQIYKLQSQIDALNKERDTILNGNDGYSGINGEIERINKLKEQYEDISSIFEENLNLEYATSYFKDFSKSVLDGTFDVNALSDAFKTYNSQIKDIDDQIKLLDNYKDNLSDIKTNAEGLYSVETASDELYSNLTDKVDALDPILLLSLKDNYKTLYNQIANNNKVINNLDENTASIQHMINTIDGTDDSFYNTYNNILQYLGQYNPEILEQLGYDEQSIYDIVNGTYILNKTIFDVSKSTFENIALNTQNIGAAFNMMNGVLNTEENTFETIMQDFIKSAKEMSILVKDSLDQIKSSSFSISSILSSNIGVGALSSSITTSSSTIAKVVQSARKALNLPKKHDGMESGYVGKSSSKKKDLFEKLSLQPLEVDEFPYILKQSEAVLTVGQQNNILDNFSKVLSFNPPLIKKDSSSKSISFSGDIIVNGVQDTNSFAKAIKNQLGQQMLQELYKK